MPYYPPDRIGGVGEFAAALHRGLLDRGIDSVVVTRGVAAPQAGVERIATSRTGWFFGALVWTRRAAAADIVHFQSGEALPTLFALRAWPGRRARLLATYHVDNRRMAAAERPYMLGGEHFGEAPSRLRSFRWVLYRWVDAAGIALADAVICVAHATARDLSHASDLAHVIHNGIAPLSPTGDREAGVELFYAGLASHRKRVNALPFVLSRVREQHPAARLRIAGFSRGDSPELDALFAARGLGIGTAAPDAVEYLGRLPAEALPAHYRAAQIALVPSAYEGLPYAILEALREATPVVATKVGGHDEIVRDGENGFLVTVDDVDAMAARCSEILSDPALAARLGESARTTVAEAFDLDAQIDAYLDYYRSLTKGTS